MHTTFCVLCVFSNVQQLSEEDVREALLEFVASNCCYGKGAAREMNITQVLATNAFHVSHESGIQEEFDLKCDSGALCYFRLQH